MDNNYDNYLVNEEQKRFDSDGTIICDLCGGRVNEDDSYWIDQLYICIKCYSEE